jgi:ankyrin repeat protein
MGIFRESFDALRAKLGGLPDPHARDEDKRTPLIEAAIDNRIDDARSLLDRGADINAQAGFTPLHYAAQNQFPELAALLIEHGANLELEDKFGNTPLWRATMHAKGRGEVIKLLLAAGADRHHRNKSDASPLDVAETIANYDMKQFYK